jgi:hypothetical protein
MTKTTNKETSKKLAEIGFNKETNFYFTEIAPDKFEAQYYTNNKEYLLLKSYDLETLLEALPNFIENGNGTENCLVVDVAFGEIHYEGDCENDALFITTTRENESLADTAGRLLILLHEKNLIKF